MPEQPLDNSTEENKQPNIEVGDIHVDGNVYGNIIVGNGNIINLPPEQQVFRSLHQLPQPPADFTGREELLAQLLADFEKGKGATITGLTGMGGIGKTALGLMVAHQIKKDYPDAQIFLDLKGTAAPLSAMDIMRHVILSLEPTADLRTLDETGMMGAYQSVLAGKHVLLFLDNARSAEQVAPLRPPETCAMLVTSRWVFGVAGLHHRRLDVMSEKNAEKFLLELCPRIDDKANELAKASACLPLALRIAGSFLGVNEDWRVERYITRLNDRKQRLNTLEQSREEAELKTEPDLLATFELSYTQLSEEEQKRWRMLGAFPGSFEVNAAAALWELDAERDAAEGAARKVLGTLLRYSLLDYDETSSRYSLHDLLADYALSQMEVEEEREARLRHASHYKEVLNVANNLYLEGSEKILTGLHLFDLEWENIRTGQARTNQDSGNSDQLELCKEYPNAGYMLLSLRLHPREYIAWLDKGLEAARKLGDKQYEGYHLGNLGSAYYNLGDVEKAIQFYEEDLAIAREISDRRGEGTALGNLGSAYYSLGDTRKAIQLYEQNLAIARETGDRRGEGQALGNLGIAYEALGDAHKAIEFHEQALVIDREIGDRRGEGQDLGNLGNATYRLGDTRKAIEFFEQRLGIARETGDRRGEGAVLGNLGIAYDSLGDTHKAIEFHEQALGIDREIGDRRGEGTALGNLGSAYFELGEYGKAETYYRQGLTMAQEIGDKSGEGNAFWGIAICKKQAGDIPGAREMFQKALKIFKEIESPIAKTMQEMLDDLEGNKG